MEALNFFMEIFHGLFGLKTLEGFSDNLLTCSTRKGTDIKYMIPPQFFKLLRKEYTKQQTAIEFTLGIDEDGAKAITIVHVEDNFCRKTGRKIVEQYLKDRDINNLHYIPNL